MKPRESIYNKNFVKSAKVDLSYAKKHLAPVFQTAVNYKGVHYNQPPKSKNLMNG